MSSEAQEKSKLMEKLLQNNDHMAGMERLEMIVSAIHHPFAHVARVVGKITPTRPALWDQSNIALRLEVGGEDGVSRPLSRVYTIRRFERETNLVEIDFIIHEGDAPAMHWLDKARKGTSVFIIGPRPHFVPDHHLGNKHAFFADDTAIPALYAILSKWPEGAQAHVYIDCAEADYAQELPVSGRISYHVHVRGQNEMVGRSGYLPAMAKSLTPKILPQVKDWQIWVACEREEARAIRQHFVEMCDINKDKMKAIGYWKRGLSASEMDTARLAYYADLHAAGKNMQEFDEFDVPV